MTLLAGCAHYPINPPLERLDPEAGYRFRNLSSRGNSDELFVILTFSGGGTRAAALAYGVMQQLRDTQVRVAGEPRRLLDEVDVISSVSGGSFVAAYYALNGDGLFDAFEDRFLRRNFQRPFIWRMLAPWTWWRRASLWFSRIDMAAEYYDKHVFDGATFGDLVRAGRRPFVILNATDMKFALPFQFTQEQFDLLYSDLSKVPIARAVAASSAFPLLFSPVTLRNHEKGVDFSEPAWVAPGLEERDISSRRYQKALQARSYVDVAERPYVHVIDGGVADNLGVRAVLHSLCTTDSAWSVRRMMDEGTVDRLVVIIVNARFEPDMSWDRHATAPDEVEVSRATILGMMNNYTFESAALLREHCDRFTRDVEARKACEELLRERGCADTSMPGVPPQDVKFHVIEVSFDRMEDEQERKRLQQLPASLALPDDEVDGLVRAGAEILAGSAAYQDLLKELNTEPAP